MAPGTPKLYLASACKHLPTSLRLYADKDSQSLGIGEISTNRPGARVQRVRCTVLALHMTDLGSNPAPQLVP